MNVFTLFVLLNLGKTDFYVPPHHIFLSWRYVPAKGDTAVIHEWIMGNNMVPPRLSVLHAYKKTEVLHPEKKSLDFPPFFDLLSPLKFQIF